MDLAQETIDYIAVSRLHHAYADIATRRAWGELDEIFVPEHPDDRSISATATRTCSTVATRSGSS